MFFHRLSSAMGNIVQNSRGISQASARISDHEAIALLGKYYNLKNLENIVGQGRSAIRPRNTQRPVSEAGMLAIAAYTSAGLDRMIRETYSSTGGPYQSRADAMALESLIVETLDTIAPTRVSFAKRNMTLNGADFRSMFNRDASVHFKRITSVTLQPHQVYRGGNVDLTIRPDFDVIDVSPLSIYSRDHARGRGEREALLVPGSVFEVIEVQQGREHSPIKPSQLGAPLHQEFWRVVLRQTAKAKN